MRGMTARSSAGSFSGWGSFSSKVCVPWDKIWWLQNQWQQLGANEMFPLSSSPGRVYEIPKDSRFSKFSCKEWGKLVTQVKSQTSWFHACISTFESKEKSILKQTMNEDSYKTKAKSSHSLPTCILRTFKM